MVSKSQRDKGAGGEREACGVLNAEFGTSVTRNLSQVRDSGTDIHLGPFAVEVKRRKRIGNIYEWVEQAKAADKRPVVMCRADGKEWLVVLPFAEWARIARGEL